MTYQAKTITNHDDLDDLFEAAVQIQQRARQNHGFTLDIKDCIGIALKDTYAGAMVDIADRLSDLVKLARDNA